MLLCQISKSKEYSKTDLLFSLISQIALSYVDFNWKTNSVLEELYQILQTQGLSQDFVSKLTANIQTALEGL
jgi:predicted transcriptional regulator